MADVIVHADWSTSPAKRWMARAVRQGDGRYVLEAPVPVGNATALLSGSGSTTLIGVDFPIGVPAHYARAIGMESFPRWLSAMTDAELERFSTPAGLPGEISLDRPFYPARPGGTRQLHLVSAHGATVIGDLHRACERKPPLSRRACTLFWTLGGNQVGRAALAGWRDLVRPGLRAAPPVKLWPFDGRLADLVAGGGAIVAETYPAECYAHLSFPRFAKTQAAGRRACLPAIEAAMARLGAEPTAGARAALASGFDSDDQFDAFVGALGMLNVLAGDRPADPPEADPAARTVEGWILGAG